MERTIILNGKETPLKATAYSLIIYQSEFNEDMFRAQDRILQAIDNTTREVIVSKIDTIATLRILWTLAKTADESLPAFNKWVKDLPDIPIIELYSDNLSLLTANMITWSDIAGSQKNAESTEGVTES